MQDSDTIQRAGPVRPIPWVKVLAMLAVVIGCYLIIAGRSTLWDRDEPRFSRATVEMIESGNYLVPTFNDALRPDKPILIYWLMSIPVRIFGTNAFACRFVSVIATSLTCLFTYLIGLRLLGARAAWWSALVLASSLLCIVIGTAATADAVLLACMTACMALFVWAWPRGRLGLWDVLGMGLALGLAQLVKGPVGLLPVLVIGTVLILQRREQPHLGCRFVAPLLVSAMMGVLMFLAWGIPANLATGGEFLRLGIGHHVLARSAHPLEGHGGQRLLFLPYYPLVTMATFFPWSLHLFGGVAHTLSGRLAGTQGRALLIGWVAAIFVLMTLVATKLPHYVLFAWPAMALMVGGTIAASQTEVLGDAASRWLRGGIWALGPVALAISVGAAVGPWFIPAPGLRPWGLLCGLVLAVMATLAIRYQLADLPLRSAKVLVAGMLLLLVPLSLGMLPAVEEFKVSPHIAPGILENTPQETPVAAFEFTEPSLNFYIGRHVTALTAKDEVIGWLGQDGPGVLIIPGNALAALEKERGPLHVKPVASVKGINYSKGREIEILAVHRISP